MSEWLSSWQCQRTPLTTARALALSDREALVMAFPLQDTTRDHTARDGVHLRPCGARLTATPAALSLTNAHAFCHVGAEAIEAADVCGWPGQPGGGVGPWCRV